MTIAAEICPLIIALKCQLVSTTLRPAQQKEQSYPEAVELEPANNLFLPDSAESVRQALAGS